MQVNNMINNPYMEHLGDRINCYKLGERRILIGLISTTYNLESHQIDHNWRSLTWDNKKQTSNAWGLRFLKTQKKYPPLGTNIFIPCKSHVLKIKLFLFPEVGYMLAPYGWYPSLNMTKTPQNRSRRDEDFIGFPDFKGTPNQLNDQPGLNETGFSQIITRESQKTFWMNSDHMNIDSHNIVFVQHLKTSHCHTHTHLLNKNHEMDQKSSATGTQTKHPHSTMFGKHLLNVCYRWVPKKSGIQAGNTF